MLTTRGPVSTPPRFRGLDHLNTDVQFAATSRAAISFFERFRRFLQTYFRGRTKPAAAAHIATTIVTKLAGGAGYPQLNTREEGDSATSRTCPRPPPVVRQTAVSGRARDADSPLMPRYRRERRRRRFLHGGGSLTAWFQCARHGSSDGRPRLLIQAHKRERHRHLIRRDYVHAVQALVT